MRPNPLSSQKVKETFNLQNGGAKKDRILHTALTLKASILLPSTTIGKEPVPVYVAVAIDGRLTGGKLLDDVAIGRVINGSEPSAPKIMQSGGGSRPSNDMMLMRMIQGRPTTAIVVSIHRRELSLKAKDTTIKIILSSSSCGVVVRKQQRKTK